MSKIMKLFTLIYLTAALTYVGCAAKQMGSEALAPKEQTLDSRSPARLPEEHGSKEAAPADAFRAVATAKARVDASVPPAQTIPHHERINAQNPIYFDFDSCQLNEEAKIALEQVYQLMSATKGVYTLEGFCDEHGDGDYNLALGERRAAGIRSYLVSRGLAADRLAVVSYGREFPARPAHTEDAWQLNRRVEIVQAGAPTPDSDKRYGVKR